MTCAGRTRFQYAKIEEKENYRKKTFETNNLETVFVELGIYR